jgi:hypothetical protein
VSGRSVEDLLTQLAMQIARASLSNQSREVHVLLAGIQVSLRVFPQEKIRIYKREQV